MDLSRIFHAPLFRGREKLDPFRFPNCSDSMVLPPFLQPGDLVLVVAPSFSANEKEVLDGIRNLEGFGFRVETGPSVFKSWGKFAGTDAERLSDLQWAMNHPTARAVFCVRGGYGLSRILPGLDLGEFRKKPKWIIGFSDITLLHQSVQETGVVSVHGPMVVHFAREEQKVATGLEIEILSGKTTTISYPVQAANPGEPKVEGILKGGNLTMLSHRAGLFPEGWFVGSVLFLEEIGEYYYRIDRMLEQMRQNHLLEGVSGVVLGQFTGCERDGFPLDIQEMILEKTGGRTPVFFGLESGHGVPTFPLLFGREVKVERSGEGFFLSQSLEAPIS